MSAQTRQVFKLCNVQKRSLEGLHVIFKLSNALQRFSLLYTADLVSSFDISLVLQLLSISTRLKMCGLTSDTFLLKIPIRVGRQAEGLYGGSLWYCPPTRYPKSHPRICRSG